MRKNTYMGKLKKILWTLWRGQKEISHNSRKEKHAEREKDAKSPELENNVLKLVQEQKPIILSILLKSDLKN